MSTLQDYCNVGDTGDTSAYGIYWRAMTFIASTSYLLAPVKLPLRRVWDGTSSFIVSIRNTISGLPSGVDLISKSLSNVQLFQNTSTLVVVVFDSSIPITAGTKYAIVLAAPTESSSTAVRWRSGTNLYAGGNRCNSSDGGVIWGASPTLDYLFEIWGNPLKKSKHFVYPAGTRRKSCPMGN